MRHNLSFASFWENDQLKRSMKKYLILLMAVCMFSCQNKSDKGYINIDGITDAELQGGRIYLHKAENGETKEIASVVISERNEFAFRVPASEPDVYVMHVHYIDQKGKFREFRTTQMKLWRFYLKGGDQIKITAGESGYKLLEKGSFENEKLTKWNHMADSLYRLGLKNLPTYKEYFPKMEKYVKECQLTKKALKTGNTDFDQWLNMVVDVDLDYFPINFIFSPNTIHPTLDDLSDYYRTIISEDKLTDLSIMKHPRGLYYLGSYAQYGVYINGKIGDRSKYIDNAVQFIPNDTLKGCFLIDKLNAFRCYDDKYIRFINTYEKYFATDDLKDRIKSFEKSIKVFGKGDPGFNFVACDINGKEFKLSDFKGKIVYVDMWATWCGPCKDEIPHLKKLEKKLAGKDVVFLKISLDKNKKAWEKYVKENRGKGYSLYMPKAFDSELSKIYNINSIPRFLMFDKEGKIITMDAPRPSELITEEMLKGLTK